MLDHARLEAGGLHHAVLALLVAGADANVHRAVDVHDHAGDREAALLEGLLVVGGPLDLGVHERAGGVGAHPVHQQPLGHAQLRRGEAEPDRVVHQPGHAGDLALERVVEAVHLGGAALEDRVAEAADERHGGNPAGLDLGIERRRSILFLELGQRCLGFVTHWPECTHAPRLREATLRR